MGVDGFWNGVGGVVEWCWTCVQVAALWTRQRGRSLARPPAGGASPEGHKARPAPNVEQQTFDSAASSLQQEANVRRRMLSD
eukprot:14661621-Alexandrium_andersonii.AAC.1